MVEMFTTNGGIKNEFFEPICNELYRVLKNRGITIVNIKNRNQLDYVMTVNNIPRLSITLNGETYKYNLEYGVVDCFDYIGGANY